MLLRESGYYAARTFTRWQYFSARNDVMAAILKVWRQVENVTPSTDAYLG